MPSRSFARLVLLALAIAAAGCSGRADPLDGDAGGTGGGPDAATDRIPPVTTAAPDPGPIRQGAVTVTLSTDEPAVTRYTLDGSTPDASSPIAAGPLVLDRSRTLRFFSVDLAGNAEVPRTARYRIDLVRRLLLDVGAN